MLGYQSQQVRAAPRTGSGASATGYQQQLSKTDEQVKLQLASKQNSTTNLSAFSNFRESSKMLSPSSGLGSATTTQQSSADSSLPTNDGHHHASPGYHSGCSSRVASPGSSAGASSPTSCSVIARSTSSSSSSSVGGGGGGGGCRSGSGSGSGSAGHSPVLASGSPVSALGLLEHFPALGREGVALSWFHEANSRAKLATALASGRLLIAADISLAEMSRYPVPIMARPPLGASDITLESWLAEVASAQSAPGVKLNFTSTRTVEPAFRVLARHADRLRGPLILSADILARPTDAGGPVTGARQRGGAAGASGGRQQPVDAWTFLMLCRTRFPRCTISIGWCAPEPGATPTAPAPAPDPPMFELDLDPLAGANFREAAAAAAAASQLARLHAAAAGSLGLGAGQRAPHHAHSLQQLQQQQQQQQSQQHNLHFKQHQQQQHHLLAAAAHAHAQAQLGPRGPHHAHQQLNLSHHQLSHRHILSSSGSLNSSSGNSSGTSSGSPSPTSPVGHLMVGGGGGGEQTVATNLSLGPARGVADSSLAGGSAGQPQQLPLNLNINESGELAARRPLGSLSALASAAKLRDSYKGLVSRHQLDQQQLEHLHQPQQQQLQQQQQQQQPQQQAKQEMPSQSHQPLHVQQAQIGQHVHKKTALFSAHSNGPAPSCASPKQTGSDNLLLKAAYDGRQQMQHQHQQQVHQHQHQHQQLRYTPEMIDKMASLVKEYNLTQPVTFPVEARPLRNSLAELQRLLYQVGANSTLTVVAKQEDLISVDELLEIRKAFSSNQLLFDLPDELAASFRQELDQLL